MIMALAGNKADLGESRAVTSEDAQARAVLMLQLQLVACCTMHAAAVVQPWIGPRPRVGLAPCSLPHSHVTSLSKNGPGFSLSAADA